MTELMHVRMAEAVDVRPRQREIDLRAVPYNQPAECWDQVTLKRYTESIAPDAFKVEKRRPNQVKILRDHSHQRVIGSLTSVHPNRDDGLHVTGRVAPTDLGRESLMLAEEGDLFVSIGFMADPAFDEWDSKRTTVVRHGCTLMEVSLVPFPAYDGAEVLAVRNAADPAGVFEPAVTINASIPPASTPNLDEILAWRATHPLTGITPM
jgi:hypothetical protein